MQKNPPAFNLAQNYMDNLQERINQINRYLDSENELLDTKVQSLHRLLLSYYTEFRQMGKHVDSQTEAQNMQSQKENEIPSQWNDDIQLFAQQALNIQLFPHQTILCRSTQRINILIAGRGAGKSLAAQVKAIHKAVTHSGHTVLVISSGQRMSSDFGIKLLDLIRETKVSQWVESISNEKVVFANGSTIHLLPANPDTIRGYHPKHSASHRGMTAILDEACFMEQGTEIQKAVEYTLITTKDQDGQLYIVSSPTASGSWVHRYVKQAQNTNSGIAVFQCGSAANHNISNSEIERLRATKNELEFRAEVLGEWVDGAYGLFAGLIEPNIIKPKRKPTGAIYALGADLALSLKETHDKNALVVAAKWYPQKSCNESSARYRIMKVLVLDHASDKELCTTINQLTKEYDLCAAAVEQFQGKGLSEHCAQLGIETQLLAASSSRQRMIFHELHRLLRQGILQLPADLHKTFFDEMKSFEYRREKNGSIRFGHPETAHAHDDTVYAAAWTIYALSLTTESVHDPPISYLGTINKTVHDL